MKVPKIRFKGENSNYIFWKFEILFSYASEWWTPDTNNKNFYLNWDIPFVKIEDTENKYIKNTKSFITKEWLKHSSAWLIPSNNIIFTNGATVWNVAINKIPVATKQGILWIIPNKNIDKEYMYYLLSNTHFQNEVKNRTAKWTFETIILRNLKEIPISLPSLPEQEKIWSLFEQLDSHISKNQQKLEKLKNMKQSFLQKLFSKDWSAFPELRFKGFEEAWEERKLGENVEEINRKDEKSTANIMMISANEWFINQSIRYSYDNFWKSLTKYTILRKGELGYNHWASKIRPYGSCFVLKQDEARVPFVYHCFKVKNNNPYFFELTLNSKQVEKKLKKIISSWARMDGLLNISYSAYVDINIVIPSLPEQEKIWAFFEKLDTQITQQTQKIQKLQNLKQSLLEKMFI